MAIKYFRSLRTIEKPRNTRPVGMRFPIGLDIDSPLQQANSATITTQQTFDSLIVAGGGNGGRRVPAYNANPQNGGGGGAGGVRVFSANNFSELSEFKNAANFIGTCNVIPVLVGSGGTNSCFGNGFVNCRGGAGGNGGWNSQPGGGYSGSPGGSGGSRGAGIGAAVGGNGIAEQGCPGSNIAAGIGGSATAPASTTGGLTTSFTGTSVTYGNGGAGASAATPGAANRGNGGNGANSIGQYGGGGGSGVVAIRYRNPAAPTTPLAQGGNCICCTGGCIIHIFNSSGTLNIDSAFSIN
jgi:hypothetical protein